MGKLKKIGHFLKVGLISKNNLKRDFILLVLVLFFVLIGWLMKNFCLINQKIEQEMEESKNGENLFIEETYNQVVAIQEKIKTDSWKKYQSNWYGFAIKYPELWLEPVGQSAFRNANWEYRYQFRKKTNGKEEYFSGFDVVIYDVAKIKELSSTDEFPKIKNNLPENISRCSNINGHLIETGDYPAEEIYIPPTDDCFQSKLFFSFTQGNYIYNIIPITENLMEVDESDPRMAVGENFPEFLAIIATAEIVEIIRPRISTNPSKPIITAPKPLSYRVDKKGRWVCAKKNDKPSKSKKTKHRHLDMECCLDPDEYPNPWCYYSKDKYGKYLK